MEHYVGALLKGGLKAPKPVKSLAYIAPASVTKKESFETFATGS